MRLRPLGWLLVSALCFGGAYYFWRLGDRTVATRGKAGQRSPGEEAGSAPFRHAVATPFQLLTQSGSLLATQPGAPATNRAAMTARHLALRLSNTSASLTELQRSDRAILLENALLDTAQAVPAIPGHLRAQGDPGAYLVQARGPVDNSFRALLRQAGAEIVSYIPNNAFLVRASAQVAGQLKAAPGMQAVLPYEPYYKLKLSLLQCAVAREPLPAGSALNVLLFADAREATRAELEKLGARILGDEERTPFGPVFTVAAPADSLAAIAGLPGVQEVEWAQRRALANDFSRVGIGVAPDALNTNNYLGLSGANVLVNLNDSGVDTNHPDLQGRVYFADPASGVDTNGHGTHVAGIIASSGGQSETVTNASSPAGPYVGVGNQFRGKAPAASLFVLPVGMDLKPSSDGATLTWPSDRYLQETAVRSNAFIANNSWSYVGNDSQTYDLHAASYDAAVRDALPTVPGSQPLLVVFPAGNGGRGDSDGTGGEPDSIASPGTAKNVITVGAVEQLRLITNETWKCSMVSTNCQTNQPWLGLSDATNGQVAAFSGRGPVGVGIEGKNGRFKPDVVAPGTFVISTRSQQWDTNAYYNPTSSIWRVERNILVPTNDLYLDWIFVPENAVQLNVFVSPNTNSPVPFPDLPIYINPTDFPTNTDPVIGTNYVSLPPALNLSPVGADWYYGIGNYTSRPVRCDLWTEIVVTNEHGNELEVLAGINDSLGPWYRYESGTSLAAGGVSGTLALMQEFFEQRLGRTNSPALMKALLINGARSVGSHYFFSPRGGVNSQGWGLVNLPTTLPGSLTNASPTTNAMVMIDQNPADALATGQSRTYKISLSPSARRDPLRITLVWTDPPGNPVAGIKLVNNLDLVVTNLDNTNFVYYGNDIASRMEFNEAWDTNLVANLDMVNNVENVYLSPSMGIDSQLSENYSITVVGRRVNVNAVTAQTNNVCQDYALVISGGDGLITNAISFDASSPVVADDQPLVTIITNSFTGSPDFVGGILFNQRAGASPQLLGTNTMPISNAANAVLTFGVTNQWRFYAITNDTPFTNAAFLTFLPANLAVPREGVFQPSADRAARPEADIDLYVAPPSIPNNAALTNLAPAVVDAATKSLGRGGTETIVYSNAIPGVYYLAVKSEDQQAAEYALLGVFSRNPFSSGDSNGVHMIGIPTLQPIPDGSPELPGVASILGIAVDSLMVRRVIVTNIVNHELIGDLIAGLSHGADYAVLNNHTCVREDASGPCQVLTSYIFDDSSELNVGPDPNFPYVNQYVQHTDGPGSLDAFAGKDGQGQWMLTMVDNATNHIGTNIALSIFLERQEDLTGNGVIATIRAGACRNDFIEVPADAISLTVTVAVVSATGPIDYTIEVCPLAGGGCQQTEVTNALGGAVTIDQTDIPPLQAGTYRVRVCNRATTDITVNIRVVLRYSSLTVHPFVSTSITSAVPILDDAITFVHLTNDTHGIISSVDVGLLISDPRISDLAITLISPNGTRVLLFENRGADSPDGIGTFNLGTNYFMRPFYTNDFDLAPVGLYTTGAVFQGWSVVSNFVEVLDDFACLCLSNHVLGLLDGAVSNALPTTRSLLATNASPYALTFKVNHLPRLEGMVAWWPFDTDGTDIFGGFNGFLLGNTAFSTGQTASFADDFDGTGLNAIWQPSLPASGTGAGATPVVAYAGAPSYTFTTVASNTVLRMSNTLGPWQRRGWSSDTIFVGQDFRYEVRFNTLAQGAGISAGGFVEIWVLDAANPNRFDVLSPFGGEFGTNRVLLAGSSIDSSFNTLAFNFQGHTWYRLVLSAAPNQGVRAAVLNDSGVELAGTSFIHGAAAFGSGFRIGLSQFVAAGVVPAPVDVALDSIRVTSGLSGKVNQACFGDGIATRMIVPRCPELDLGLRRGFSIEGWINPVNVGRSAPLAEWYDPVPPTNQPSTGVQFWLALTNGAGSLGALIWDTNSQPHVVSSPPGVITNSGWQHVALTYDTNSGLAALYVNGLTNNQPLVATNLGVFVPRTSGDLYFGFDPTVLPVPINYINFLSLAGLNLAGSAGQTGAVLRLTAAADSLVGGAFASKKQLCATGFDTRFQFQITSPGARPGTTPGGDGFMFTVQNLGPNDSGWHPPPTPVNNYVGVFFNTFLNWPGCTNYTECDVSSNAVGIVSNGLYVAQTDLTPLGINLKDGAVHAAHIAFDGEALTVWLDGVMVLTNVPVPGLATAVDAAGYAWVGFGAGTGWAWENHDILSWTFGGPTPGTSFAGGLDEFSVYGRALSPCEVNAIYNAGSHGKYGTNALICPVVTEVTLSNSLSGTQVFTFTNGLDWAVNGPRWETNTIAFSSSTNPTAITLRGLNPYDSNDPNAPNNLNVMVDDFVLSELVPQTFDGLLHFSENTNLATIPIKFAPAPFLASNFPPVLVFSNDFVWATSGVYQAGEIIAGNPNSPGVGQRDWTVIASPVSVVSNAFLAPTLTNWLAMATGAVQCLLPTIPGHRYELSYNLRGPCAVGWWDGSVDPLSRRARDIIGGNHGVFINSATTTPAGYVNDRNASEALWFPGIPWPTTNSPWYAFAPKIELGDPANLHFTNSFTIEGWINSVPHHTNDIGVSTLQQIFFRGDSRDCRDPYYLALQWHRTWEFDLIFHVEGANSPGCGVSLITTNHPVKTNTWMHVAAVFEANVPWAPNAPWPTNELRLYLDGQLLTNVFLSDPALGAIESSFTGESPFADLAASYQPGITIGNSSRYDNYEPFCGYIDELSVYARALTAPEIVAIAAAGTVGKADLSVPVAQSLARVNVSVDGKQLGIGYGDNSRWSNHTLEFTALGTNAILTLQSLLPGTLLADVTLTELAPELYYLPEESLADLAGEDMFGIWTLEIWDNRMGPGTNNAQLVDWVLNLGLAPSNPPPVITLAHGLPYTNSLPAHGIQYFVIPTPQWALLATNVLQFAQQVRTGNPLPLTVLFNQTNFPAPGDFPLLGPLVSAGVATLNSNSTPLLIPGQTYYLAVTNPNPVGITFALGVWFDITTLPNCQLVVSNLVSPAGIPRYFQFDVLPNAATPGLPPESVAFWLSGADCNLKVVLSEHLPLPDLNHYDYISQQPCTNIQVIMLVTNYTPFPIQTNRWYVGVFNTGPTNMFVDVQACYTTNSPVIIPLTNGVPFVVPFTNSLFAAPPGPPRWFFFEFQVTNSVPGVLFELYNLSGDADLLLQQNVPPTMAPYFSSSFFSGRNAEQIVVRTSATRPASTAFSDLRGHWYLGVYNYEDANVTYTIRAMLPNDDGLLSSALPLRLSVTSLAFPRGLVLSWNSVVGERYIVQYTPSIAAPVIWTNVGAVTATTTLTTFEVLPIKTGGFYRVVQIFDFQPRLKIQLSTTNQVRISWPTLFSGYTLQYKLGLFGTWTNVAFPPATGVFTIGDEFVVYDPIGPVPKYYRLIK